jgi:hypothetical protein
MPFYIVICIAARRFYVHEYTRSRHFIRHSSHSVGWRYLVDVAVPEAYDTSSGNLDSGPDFSDRVAGAKHSATVVWSSVAVLQVE